MNKFTIFRSFICKIKIYLLVFFLFIWIRSLTFVVVVVVFKDIIKRIKRKIERESEKKEEKK